MNIEQIVVDSSISELTQIKNDNNIKDILANEDNLMSRMLILSSELVAITSELHRKNVALKKANETITELMHTDHLTGLSNRRFFIEMLVKFLSYANRHHTPLSIAMADLDQFKVVNDTYGHHAGDQVLVTFASILRNYSRREDIQARFGGEEFIVLLPNTKKPEAEVFSERVRQTFEKLELPNVSSQVTSSFGITQMVAEDTTESIIKRVDEALYDAKRSGGNRISTK